MIDWQLGVVVTVVFISAALLLRRTILWMGGKQNGCSKCSQNNRPDSIKVKPLTQISIRKE